METLNFKKMTKSHNSKFLKTRNKDPIYSDFSLTAYQSNSVKVKLY